MYPVVFTIPIIDFPISSFGLMMALGFLAATWVTAARMREEGLDPELATSLLLYVMIGGVLGSKLYYAIDVSLREGLPFTSLLFARDGITWYGGLIAGLAVGAVGCRINHLPIVTAMNCSAAGVALGQAFGRIGCLLVGDDYGHATEVPWAMSFPLGAPPTLELVHPTQLYEALWLLGVAGWLWNRRRRSPFLFGEYLVLQGLGRLTVEIWRINPRVALGMTEAQWIGVALFAIGTVTWLRFRQRQRTA
jgi:phosphatidylglycerol:prolipoprotein diacylglycerol transferase